MMCHLPDRFFLGITPKWLMGTVNLDTEGMGMDLNDLAFWDFCLEVFCQSLK